jgi:hypothetical protein
MINRRTLHQGYERLIGTAVVDSTLGSNLLRDPRGTALAFGLAPADADIVADIRAADLRTFAAALLPRLYGKGATDVYYRSAAAG